MPPKGQPEAKYLPSKFITHYDDFEDSIRDNAKLTADWEVVKPKVTTQLNTNDNELTISSLTVKSLPQDENKALELFKNYLKKILKEEPAFITEKTPTKQGPNGLIVLNDLIVDPSKMSNKFPSISKMLTSADNNAKFIIPFPDTEVLTESDIEKTLPPEEYRNLYEYVLNAINYFKSLLKPTNTKNTTVIPETLSIKDLSHEIILKWYNDKISEADRDIVYKSISINDYFAKYKDPSPGQEDEDEEDKVAETHKSSLANQILLIIAYFNKLPLSERIIICSIGWIAQETNKAYIRQTKDVMPVTMANIYRFLFNNLKYQYEYATPLEALPKDMQQKILSNQNNPVGIEKRKDFLYVSPPTGLKAPSLTYRLQNQMPLVNMNEELTKIKKDQENINSILHNVSTQMNSNMKIMSGVSMTRPQIKYKDTEEIISTEEAKAESMDHSEVDDMTGEIKRKSNIIEWTQVPYTIIDPKKIVVSLYGIKLATILEKKSVTPADFSDIYKGIAMSVIPKLSEHIPLAKQDGGHVNNMVPTEKYIDSYININEPIPRTYEYDMTGGAKEDHKYYIRHNNNVYIQTIQSTPVVLFENIKTTSNGPAVKPPFLYPKASMEPIIIIDPPKKQGWFSKSTDAAQPPPNANAPNANPPIVAQPPPIVAQPPPIAAQPPPNPFIVSMLKNGALNGTEKLLLPMVTEPITPATDPHRLFEIYTQITLSEVLINDWNATKATLQRNLQNVTAEKNRLDALSVLTILEQANLDAANADMARLNNEIQDEDNNIGLETITLNNYNTDLKTAISKFNDLTTSRRANMKWKDDQLKAQNKAKADQDAKAKADQDAQNAQLKEAQEDKGQLEYIIKSFREKNKYTLEDVDNKQISVNVTNIYEKYPKHESKKGAAMYLLDPSTGIWYSTFYDKIIESNHETVTSGSKYRVGYYSIFLLKGIPDVSVGDRYNYKNPTGGVIPTIITDVGPTLLTLATYSDHEGKPTKAYTAKLIPPTDPNRNIFVSEELTFNPGDTVKIIQNTLPKVGTVQQLPELKYSNELWTVVSSTFTNVTIRNDKGSIKIKLVPDVYRVTKVGTNYTKALPVNTRVISNFGKYGTWYKGWIVYISPEENEYRTVVRYDDNTLESVTGNHGSHWIRQIPFVSGDKILYYNGTTWNPAEVIAMNTTMLPNIKLTTTGETIYYAKDDKIAPFPKSDGDPTKNMYSKVYDQLVDPIGTYKQTKIFNKSPTKCASYVIPYITTPNEADLNKVYEYVESAIINILNVSRICQVGYLYTSLIGRTLFTDDILIDYFIKGIHKFESLFPEYISDVEKQTIIVCGIKYKVVRKKLEGVVSNLFIIKPTPDDVPTSICNDMLSKTGITAIAIDVTKDTLENSLTKMNKGVDDPEITTTITNISLFYQNLNTYLVDHVDKIQADVDKANKDKTDSTTGRTADLKKKYDDLKVTLATNYSKVTLLKDALDSAKTSNKPIEIQTAKDDLILANKELEKSTKDYNKSFKLYNDAMDTNTNDIPKIELNTDNYVYNNNNCAINIDIPPLTVGGNPFSKNNSHISHAWSIPPGRV